MSTAMKILATERRIHLVLEDTAEHLTSRDLRKITEAADQAHEVVQIRYGTWQVLVSVPEINFQKLTEGLSAIGYRCAAHYEKVSEVSTFPLGGITI